MKTYDDSVGGCCVDVTSLARPICMYTWQRITPNIYALKRRDYVIAVVVADKKKIRRLKLHSKISTRYSSTSLEGRRFWIVYHA